MRRFVVAHYAHKVAKHRLWAVQRVSGLFSLGWAAVVGWWIINGGAAKLTGQQWKPLIEFVGDYRIPGAVLLAGAILGFIGLGLETPWLSLLATMICAAWCGWVGAFLWVANMRGDENLGSWFAILGLGMYLLRFYLLLPSRQRDEAVDGED
jgi:hypothetical protein